MKAPQAAEAGVFESRIFNPVAVRLLQFNMLAEGLSAEPDWWVHISIDSLDFQSSVNSDY